MIHVFIYMNVIDNTTFQSRFKAILDEGNMGYVKYTIFILDLFIHVYIFIYMNVYGNATFKLDLKLF
jgi:hypothetical protein